MASDALRRLSARVSQTLITSDGYNGYSGYSVEKPDFSCNQNDFAGGYSGYKPGPVDHSVTGVTTSENRLVTEKPSFFNDVTTVTSVTGKNDKVRHAERWPPRSEPGLTPYTIRDLARWYEEEGLNRHRGAGLDQNVLDRDLRRKIVEEHGVLPEFIEVEFDRVMQVVFAV